MRSITSLSGRILVSSYSATVAAMAAFSDSDCDRDVARPRRTRRARRPGSPSRSAPTSSVGSPSTAAAAAAAPRRAQPGRSSCPAARRPPRRARPAREDRAHRGPHGLGPERIGAVRAEHDARRAERERGAQDRADVARVADAPQGDAQRAGRRGPALLVDAERPRARAQRRRPWPAASGSTSMPSSPLPAAHELVERRPAGGARAAASRSSPSATNRPAASRSRRAAGLRISLSFALWWAGDHGFGRKQKGAVLDGCGAR